MPSLLSESAIDFFGRQESHIRNLPWSRRTQMSKQVPYCPPSTGFPGNFCQPPPVAGLAVAAACERGDESRPAIAIRTRNSLLCISSFSVRGKKAGIVPLTLTHNAHDALPVFLIVILAEQVDLSFRFFDVAFGS